MRQQWRRINWGACWAAAGASCIVTPAFAQGGSLGDLARSVVGLEKNVRGLIRAAAILAGVGFLLGSVIQFKKHLDNPSEVRLGTPIVLLICGVGLIGLAFIPMPVK